MYLLTTNSCVLTVFKNNECVDIIHLFFYVLITFLQTKECLKNTFYNETVSCGINLFKDKEVAFELTK